MDIFTKAAKILNEQGWCQGSAGSANGPMDVDTAILFANIELHQQKYPQSLNRFRKVIGQTQILAWNDAPGRTKEQVIQALNQAAK